MAFILKAWNKKWGADAAFIAQNEANGKYTEFTAGKTTGLTWTDKDLTNMNAGWEKWEEKVDNLEDVEL